MVVKEFAGLYRRPICDPEVLGEQAGCFQSVSFRDVELDRERRTLELGPHCTERRRPMTHTEIENTAGDLFRLLPGE